MKAPQLFFAVIAISVTFVSSLSPKSVQNAFSARLTRNEDYRLPNNTVPRHYDIKLIPYLENDAFNFAGELDIDVTLVEPSSTITFHADQLEINSITVSSVNAVHLISSTSNNSDAQFYTLTFASALPSGNYTIHIEYTGQLHDDLKGFYRSYYNTSSGEIRWYASSFFAPIYARRAFPCFDEPALKAEFTISIAHWPNQTAISNALFESVSAPNASIGNRVWTKFQTTPLMSTYLVAFQVSDFGFVESNNGSFRIWARPEALATANTALDSISLLNELSTFIGIDYNSILPKMDQVALSRSASVAMENWGLITYSEAWLLWQDGVSTTRDKQNIATVGAHEFAHQWFGNLVTPAWWNYVWLSEGFASFFEYYTVAQVYPSWRLMEQFTVDLCHPALLADSLNTTHPINDDVASPEEVNSVFNLISYNKGACLIQMLSNLVGESVFQKGLQIYQENNSFGTGTPDKLWSALTEANENSTDSILIQHVDIKTVMDTWTNQKGYPVVTVTRNYTVNSQLISQEPFLLQGRGSSNNVTEYRWWIPLNIASQTSPNFTVSSLRWLRAQDESVVTSGFSDNEWVIFNGQQAGYYRVNYDEQNWGMIARYLETSNFTDIPPITRAQLIDDAFNLARAGYLNYTVALPLTRYLSQETDHVPWTAAFQVYAYLSRMLAKSNAYANLETYLFSRVRPIHNNLGYAVQDSDEHVTNFLRAESHSWACRLGCPGCNNQAQQLIQNFYNSGGNSSIPVDLRIWAYCEGLRRASVEVWDFMWNRYLETDVAGEQARILSGLGCSLDEEILERYLNFSITENSGLRSQHRLSIFSSVYLRSPSNVDVALGFLLNNTNELSASHGGFSAVRSLLENLAAHLVSESQLATLRAYISQQADQLGEAASAARHALAIAEENIAWLDTYESDIVQWLATEVDSASNSLAAFGPILLVSVYAILNFAS